MIDKAPARAAVNDESHQKVPTKMATEIGKEGTPSTTTGEPLKQPLLIEQTKLQKKAKASKWDRELTTLTKGDIGDTGDTVREATWDAIDEAMLEQQIVLRELRAQL